MFDFSRVLDSDYLDLPADHFWQSILAGPGKTELACLQLLLPLSLPAPDALVDVESRTLAWIDALRGESPSALTLEHLLREYPLAEPEGRILMQLAEALLRIPDAATADALVHSLLPEANWSAHEGQTDDWRMNVSAWCLSRARRLLVDPQETVETQASVWQGLVGRMGERLVRSALQSAISLLGKQFVLGEYAEEALEHAEPWVEQGYGFSFDMLGEAARSESVAADYLTRYHHAIELFGSDGARNERGVPPSVSVKLSALHPRFEPLQAGRILPELVARVCDLARHAREKGVGLTLDAEEMDRLELSLQVFRQVFMSPVCEGWGQFGLAVQAYSRRALPVLFWLRALACQRDCRIPVRLVKGAYWDSEIKWAQQRGLDDYPVFTHKDATDVSYLVCARWLLQARVAEWLQPQFATHNAQTLACVLSWVEPGQRCEFQRLYGMGEALYQLARKQFSAPVRIYAPVGERRELLPYLVRRMLENGANTSFLARLADPVWSAEDLACHPALSWNASLVRDRLLPLPGDLFGAVRRNSCGWDLLSSGREQVQWLKVLQGWQPQVWWSAPVVCGEVLAEGKADMLYNPANLAESVGQANWATPVQVTAAITVADQAFLAWNRLPVSDRAGCLQRLAGLLEHHRGELMALCLRESGKTVMDALDEVREAIDYCRYYAVEAVRLTAQPQRLPAPVGESSELYFEGRGVVVCISPWNFPLAIFVGQVVAALVCGNTVVAKPARQGSLLAFRVTALIHAAGIPARVFHLLPGAGEVLENSLFHHPKVAGVAFTGSLAVAARIQQVLAFRAGPLVPLVAETGGQNVMLVDSTALPEQVVCDVMQSAFNSAGQRCSSLRVLYLQHEIANEVEALLAGALQSRVVGNPARLDTDVGPVITPKAQTKLLEHLSWLAEHGRLIAQAPLQDGCEAGCFVAPAAYAINSITELTEEHFGPVLHVIRYALSDLDRILSEVQGTGFGLTLGIQSRDPLRVARIERSIRAGNTYVNRNQVGAVVGVHPFGGLGLSGTGPKAGGPHYLLRWLVERVRTVNTAASGGCLELFGPPDQRG